MSRLIWKASRPHCVQNLSVGRYLGRGALGSGIFNMSVGVESKGHDATVIEFNVVQREPLVTDQRISLNVDDVVNPNALHVRDRRVNIPVGGSLNHPTVLHYNGYGPVVVQGEFVSIEFAGCHRCV